MRNIYRMIAVAVLMLSAVAAFAQSYGRYEVRHGRVYYENRELREADTRTIQDLGHGYAKDSRNVYWKGEVLPYVDPASFRLNIHHGQRPPGPERPGQRPGYPGGRHEDSGYVVMGNSVIFNGKRVKGARASSFQDLGWGYAKDTFDVYYLGEELDDASPSSFEVLKDGYAKDSFSVFYCGEEIDGAWSSTFKVLEHGYAEDAIDTYYLGRELD